VQSAKILKETRSANFPRVESHSNRKKKKVNFGAVLACFPVVRWHLATRANHDCENLQTAETVHKFLLVAKFNYS